MMAQATRNAPFKVVAGRDLSVIPRAATTPVPITTPTQLAQLPATVNVAAYQGDDLSFTLTATNPDNSPVDFTGATILAQVRSKPGDATVAATFTTSVTANVITLTLAAVITAPLSGVFVWDCQVTYSTGQIHTLAAGTLSMTPDVSHIP